MALAFLCESRLYPLLLVRFVAKMVIKRRDGPLHLEVCLFCFVVVGTQETKTNKQKTQKTFAATSTYRAIVFLPAVAKPTGDIGPQACTTVLTSRAGATAHGKHASSATQMQLKL